MGTYGTILFRRLPYFAVSGISSLPLQIIYGDKEENSLPPFQGKDRQKKSINKARRLAMKMWSLLQLADDRSVYGEKKERGIYIEGGRQRSRGINVDSAREEKKQLVPPEIHHGRANNKEMEISILRVCISIYLSISKHPPAVDRNLPVCWSERSKLIQKKRFLFLDMFIKPYISFLSKKKKLFP